MTEPARKPVEELLPADQIELLRNPELENKPLATVEARSLATHEADAVLSMIERASRDPQVDMEKFQRLMEMKEKVAGEAARRAFNSAMAGCQLEIKPVAANAENTQTNSVYATLDAIGDAIDPIIAKHGFSQSFYEEECPKKDHIRIVCTLAHSEGHELTRHLDVPVDAAGLKGTVNKTPTHAFGSTLRYGQRYLTLFLFNVKTRKVMRDDDGNAAGLQTVTDDQLEQLHKALCAVHGDEAKFCQFFKIANISDLPARNFEDAIKTIQIVGRNKAKQGVA